MNFALGFYQRMRREAPRRRVDFTTYDVMVAAMRAAMPAESRRVLLADLASLMRGHVPCPRCKANGPHRSNDHHRINKLVFTCASCAANFNLTEITT